MNSSSVFKFNLLSIILFIVLLVGCKSKSPITPVNMYYTYFPLNEGDYRIYLVDSVVYYGTSFNEKPDSFQFQLKDIIKGTLMDGAGNKVYLIERYKQDSFLNWQFQKNYTALVTKTEAQVVDDNQRYVKLMFPIETGKKWDGDKYNMEDSLEERESEIIEAHKSFTLNNIVFDSTVTVKVEEFQSFVDDKLWIEKYATGTGYINTERKSLNIQPDPIDFNKKKITGFIFKQQLIEKGHL